MNEKHNLLGESYKNLYSDYYQNKSHTVSKREISALQTTDTIGKIFNQLSIKKLIDVGAGEGSVLNNLFMKSVAQELHAVEISESGVQAIAAKNILPITNIHLFDGYKIPYSDKFFNVAISVQVLEHVEHERLFLQEIKRVSDSVFIEVPLEHGFKIKRSIESGKKYGHINFYTIDTLKSMMESSGMKVIHYGVVAPSLQYEQHISGRVKGLLKNSFRKTMLKIFPSLAPWMLSYIGYVYCDCNSNS